MIPMIIHPVSIIITIIILSTSHHNQHHSTITISIIIITSQSSSPYHNHRHHKYHHNPQDPINNTFLPICPSLHHLFVTSTNDTDHLPRPNNKSRREGSKSCCSLRWRNFWWWKVPISKVIPLSLFYPFFFFSLSLSLLKKIFFLFLPLSFSFSYRCPYLFSPFLPSLIFLFSHPFFLYLLSLPSPLVLHFSSPRTVPFSPLTPPFLSPYPPFISLYPPFLPLSSLRKHT